MIAILSGQGQRAHLLAFWRDLLPGPVEVMALPPITALDGLIEHFAAEIPDDALVVGESLGGLIALGLAGRGYRAVAFDPPLTMAKQWGLQYGLRLLLAKGDDVLRQRAASIFGVMPEGAQEERIYYWLLDAIRTTADIVSGNKLLFPAKHAYSDACLVDEVDRYVIGLNPMIRFTRIPGPHCLLTESVDASREVILRAVREMDAVSATP